MQTSMATSCPDPHPSDKGSRSIVGITGAIRVASEVYYFSLLQSRRTVSALFLRRVERRQPSLWVAGPAREQQRLEGEKYPFVHNINTEGLGPDEENVKSPREAIELPTDS